MNIVRRLKEFAWREYQVARQISTGQAETYIATWRIPGWFISQELGFGNAEGPSLLWNLLNLERTNRRNRSVLNRRAGAELKSTSDKKRTTGRDIARVLRKQAKRMGVDVRRLPDRVVEVRA